MTIVTQENDLINFDAIKCISAYAAHLGDEDGREVEVYTLLAFDFNTSVSLSDELDDENENAAISLGVFLSEEECNNVISKLISEINTGAKVFIVPQPSTPESSDNK